MAVKIEMLRDHLPKYISVTTAEVQATGTPELSGYKTHILSSQILWVGDWHRQSDSQCVSLGVVAQSQGQGCLETP